MCFKSSLALCLVFFIFSACGPARHLSLQNEPQTSLSSHSIEPLRLEYQGFNNTNLKMNLYNRAPHPEGQPMAGMFFQTLIREKTFSPSSQGAPYEKTNETANGTLLPVYIRANAENEIELYSIASPEVLQKAQLSRKITRAQTLELRSEPRCTKISTGGMGCSLGGSLKPSEAKMNSCECHAAGEFQCNINSNTCTIRSAFGIEKAFQTSEFLSRCSQVAKCMNYSNHVDRQIYYDEETYDTARIELDESFRDEYFFPSDSVFLKFRNQTIKIAMSNFDKFKLVRTRTR